MQANAHIQMANYFSQIRGFLNMPETDRRGLRYLLWQILRKSTQNVPQITKDVSEQLIEYITVEADRDEEETFNKNMDFLSEILHDTTTILKSDSEKKRIDLEWVALKLERKAEKQPEYLVIMEIARKIILAACKLLLYNTMIEPARQANTTSQKEDGDQKVPERMEQIKEEEDKNFHSTQ